MGKRITFLFLGLLFTSYSFSAINPYIDSLNPKQNAINIIKTTNIIVYFSQAMNPSTINSNSIKVVSSITGYKNCTITYSSLNNTVLINPLADFKYGDQVQVLLKSDIKTASNINITPFTFCFITLSAPAPATFYQGSSVSVGSFPETIAEGDYNNDGSLDIAVTNLYSSSVSVLINSGTGSFINSSTLSVGSNPRSIVSADFDNDGDIDFAVATHQGGTVVIFKNNETGNFTQSQVMNLGNAPYALVVGDYDQDGYLDLALANYNISSVSILKNNGTGNFSVIASYGVAIGPQFLSTGDFNNDGSLDIAVSCWNSNSVSILKNNGNGSFFLSQTLIVGTNPHSLGLGDFDKDGFLDIIVVNSNSYNLSILKNNGNGSFIQNSNIYIGTQTISVIVADLNGDGNIDVAVSSSQTGVSIYLNNESGSFTLSATYPIISYPRRLAFGDYDGDGKIDLAVPSQDLNNIIILRNGNTPPIAPVLEYPPNGATGIILTPTLIWYAVNNADGYKVQVSNTSGFTNIIDSATVTTNQRTIPAGKLSGLTTYFWRVNAFNSYGTGPWSSVWNFTTLMSIPPAPVLISPANNSIGVSLTPTLYWSAISGVSNYKAQVSLYQNFVTLIDSAIVTNNQYQIPSGKLTNAVKYYWRVNAASASGTGPWSAIWNFTTLITGINNISSEIPKEFRLYENYPNPFNPETKIKFDISKSTNVIIIVYDDLGRKVKNLTNQVLAPGKYETSFNASEFSSGIYYYRIITEDYSATKKMLLIK